MTDKEYREYQDRWEREHGLPGQEHQQNAYRSYVKFCRERGVEPLNAEAYAYESTPASGLHVGRPSNIWRLEEKENANAIKKN